MKIVKFSIWIHLTAFESMHTEYWFMIAQAKLNLNQQNWRMMPILNLFGRT